MAKPQPRPVDGPSRIGRCRRWFSRRRSIMRDLAGSGVDHIETLARKCRSPLVYNGVSHAGMMASPADLEDFAMGFTLSEGIAENPQPKSARFIQSVLTPASRDPDPAFGPREWRLKDRRRNDRPHWLRHLRRRQPGAGDPADDASGFRPAGLDGRHLSGADALPRQRSSTIAPPALLHAAAFCDAGGKIAFWREDIGRHNAPRQTDRRHGCGEVDPAGGLPSSPAAARSRWCRRRWSPASPVLVAVSAPTLMAKRPQTTNNLTLVALARADSALVVCHGERIVEQRRVEDKTAKLVHMANQIADFFQFPGGASGREYGPAASEEFLGAAHARRSRTMSKAAEWPAARFEAVKHSAMKYLAKQADPG